MQVYLPVAPSCDGCRIPWRKSLLGLGMGRTETNTQYYIMFSGKDYVHSNENSQTNQQSYTKESKSLIKSIALILSFYTLFLLTHNRHNKISLWIIF